jgi:XTP/dITP diphosphohydrolase
MRELVVATRNKGKIAEISRIFSGDGHGLKVISVAEFDLPDIEETGETFEENALLKARNVAASTGRLALADDSGLSVERLNGAPGVYSARWSGAHGDDQANIAKLLSDMSKFLESERGAAFVSVVALALPDGRAITARGEIRGSITSEVRGKNGFGYDPIFIPEGGLKTFAEMAPSEKDAISHRARALNALVPKMGTFIAGG